MEQLDTVWRRIRQKPASVDAIATVTPAADRLVYFTGATTASLAVYTAFARTLDAAINAAAARTILEVPSSAEVIDALAGKADLVDGKIPANQIPSIAITEYLGDVANEAAMLALTGEKGDWCNRTDTQSMWILTGDDPTQVGDWTEILYQPVPVTSVNGEIGDVIFVTANAGSDAAFSGTTLNLPSMAVSGVDRGLIISSAQVLPGTKQFSGGVFIGDPGYVKGAWFPLSGTISRLIVGSDGVSGGIELSAGGGNVADYMSSTRGDVRYYRNATGPKASIRAAGGLEVKTLDGSSDAPIRGSTITTSRLDFSSLPDVYTYLGYRFITSPAGYFTFFDYTDTSVFVLNPADHSLHLTGAGGLTGGSNYFTVDTKIVRNATGPKWSLCAAGGLEVKDLAGSADAPITCSTVTANAYANYLIKSSGNSGIGVLTSTFLVAYDSGVAQALFGNNGSGYSKGVTVPSDGRLAFAVNTTVNSGDGVCIVKSGSDGIEINNGTAGTYRDLSARAATFSGQFTNALGTITTSTPATFSQTWNSAGTTFTAMQVDITNTASLAGSRYLDFRRGGSSRMAFRDGSNTGGSAIVLTGTGTNVGLGLSYQDVAGFVPYVYFDVYNIRANLGSVGMFGWASSNDASGASDTAIARRSAGVIEFNNGTLISGGGTYSTIYAGAATFTKANGAAITALGGGSRTHIGIGRTTEEASIGIAGAAGQYASGSSIGDVCITSGGTLHIANFTTGLPSNLRAGTVQVGNQATHSLTVGTGVGSTITGYYAGVARSSVWLNAGSGHDIMLSTAAYVWLGDASSGNNIVQIGPTSFNTTVRTHTLKAAGRSSFGAYTGAGHHLKIAAGEADGTDLAGGNLTLYGGQGTGTGVGGSFIVQVAPPGSTGASLNTLIDALTVNSSGQVTSTFNTSLVSIGMTVKGTDGVTYCTLGYGGFYGQNSLVGMDVPGGTTGRVNVGAGQMHLTHASGNRSRVLTYGNLELSPGQLGGGGTYVEINNGTAGTYRDLRLRDGLFGGVIRQAAELLAAPSGTTQTLILDNGNLQTIDLGSTTGDTTVTLTVPSSSAVGSILITQHGATARDITWAASAGSIIWLGTEPTWNADGVGTTREVRWRFNGTNLYLEASGPTA